VEGVRKAPGKAAKSGERRKTRRCTHRKERERSEWKGYRDVLFFQDEEYCKEPPKASERHTPRAGYSPISSPIAILPLEPSLITQSHPSSSL
jgi:hypothetical protein